LANTSRWFRDFGQPVFARCWRCAQLEDSGAFGPIVAIYALTFATLAESIEVQNIPLCWPLVLAIGKVTSRSSVLCCSFRCGLLSSPVNRVIQQKKGIKMDLIANLHWVLGRLSRPSTWCTRWWVVFWAR
jgi:hypothetical protein